MGGKPEVTQSTSSYRPMENLSHACGRLGATVHEYSVLLGHGAVQIGTYVPTFRRRQLLLSTGKYKKSPIQPFVRPHVNKAERSYFRSKNYV